MAVEGLITLRSTHVAADGSADIRQRSSPAQVNFFRAVYAHAGVATLMSLPIYGLITMP
jgi:hypothetical protein